MSQNEAAPAEEPKQEEQAEAKPEEQAEVKQEEQKEEPKPEQQEEAKKEPQEAPKKDKKLLSMEERIQNAINVGITKADTNKNGLIEEEEFLFLLVEINDDITDNFARALFHGIDVEGKGHVRFEVVRDLLELLRKNWCEIDEKNKYPVELLKVYFRAMDKDHSNTVNLQEMMDFLRTVDENLSTHASAIKLRKMDKDNSGNISFYEYCKSFGVEVQKGTGAYNGQQQSSCCLLI